MQSAVEGTLLALDAHKWVPMASPNLRRAQSEAAPKEGAPPYALMEHPPLAVLANGLLAALNELRHCAPLSLQARLAAVLQVIFTLTSNFSPVAWFLPACPTAQRSTSLLSFFPTLLLLMHPFQTHTSLLF